jgi:hypothetical protein
MADARNPEFLKIVRGQMAQHFAADAILSECRLVALKTECSQPVPDVHYRSPTGRVTKHGLVRGE